MNDIELPILKKIYDLYKTFHSFRKVMPKCDRFTIFERSEDLIIDVIELFTEAGYGRGSNKVMALDRASVKLNTLRLLIRLTKDTGSLDLKKYTALQTVIDEIGRMLGGWIRSMK
ncbi:MAG: hypothetical protein A2431_00020 [Candidatus Zambryskibacteria bacterium RIFOXYC1_FULL_39_10]|uniref:bAvd-like domain-containing protein n=1 Tax=Candidatus Zambryskibacteria bacterium RIFOXYC1_FULL_39_10 TaxID=1802779 RepID=A0A1G2UYM9_9BACT|nr:MAG: hypothetical protein A2431_00020 [Candidatus Zambryskibacteria bacterium RIFOXYC1_FULL_39_10]OHB15031.1 MAG: hypothetical protein A2605_00540 [Candidatus Zambryskibacteria bacterium RIFOXYD1_FULL_39_35]